MTFLLRRSGSAEKQSASSYAAVEGDPDGLGLNGSNQPPVVPGWPTSPHRIWTSPVWIACDLLLLLLPIAFIGT